MFIILFKFLIFLYSLSRFHIQKQYQVGEDGQLEKNPSPQPKYNPDKYKIITPNN